MPVSIPINLEDYARTISPEAPSGVNLRDDPTAAATWSTIRDFRDEARRTERRADDGGDDSSWRSAVPTWAKARDLSLGLLRDKTHDLAVAAVLTEALLRTDGFAGLAAGFDIARTMIQSQWYSLFPVPDPEDGPADEETVANERILPLTRLIGLDTDGLLIAAILNAPLTDGRSCDPLGLGHHRISQSLQSLQGLADGRSPEADRGGRVVTPEQFKTAVLESQKEFLADVYGDLNRAATAWIALSESVATASGAMAVLPTGNFTSLFAECREVLRSAAPARIAAIESESTPPTPATDVSLPENSQAQQAASTGSPPLASAVITREDAVLALARVAEFFEKSDPHSLVAVQIRNIVRMASLPRDQYYRELIGDPAVLTSVGKFVGLSFEEPT
jgi:type VI secretion system protein ImpA